MGVSLWLCPKKSSGIYDKLETVMSSLNTVFPGQPPKFEPHVTITSNIALNLENPKDDVDRILSACCIALESLPKNDVSQDWVRLGSVDSQRKYFKKLYFQVLRNATLESFARIVRELFVILPRRTEEEHKIKNPHLFHKDSSGNIVRRRKSLSKKSHKEEVVESPIDLPRIQQESAQEAAQWSTQEYDPHVSLVYSDLHPIDNALWRTIRSRVSDYLSIENCDSKEWNVDGNGASWEGGVLKLVYCEGDVNDWAVLGSVDLHM